MSVIDTDTIAGIEVDGIWTPKGGVPFCGIYARTGDKVLGELHTIALLDLEEVTDLIDELSIMRDALERKEAEW